jgi:hypothetical protein
MFTERESWFHAGLEYFLAKFHRNLQREGFQCGDIRRKKCSFIFTWEKLMHKRLKLRLNKQNVNSDKQKLIFGISDNRAA